MPTAITEPQEQILDWAARHLGLRPFRDATAIGVIDQRGEPIGACVYHDFRRCCITDAPLSLNASIVSTTPRWATPRVLETLFAYAFEQVGVARMETMCRADAPKVIRFNERLGFRREATVRCGWGLTVDGIRWFMLRDDCPWLSKEKADGRQES